jgi:predicted MFS family arabinose efflux permease
MTGVGPAPSVLSAKKRDAANFSEEASVETQPPFCRTAALAAAQAFFSLNSSVVITLGSLSGSVLAPEKALATVPVGCLVVGSALSTAPARLLIQAVGWRIGFLIGGFAGVTGGALAIYAIMRGAFGLFCLAMGCVGVYQAFAYYYRFAAADEAAEADKARIVGWVMFGGTAAAVIGPSLVPEAEKILAPVQFAGGFLVAVAASLGGMVSALLLSGRPAALRAAAPEGEARPLPVLLRQKRLLVAIGCGMIASASMALLMHSSPIAMIECGVGYSVKDVAVPIQWHVVAMFGPSLFVGRLIDKFGAEPVILAGMALIAGASIVALSGVSLSQFSIALALLGVGWNLAYMGSTVVVTGCCLPTEKSKVQAFNDFCMLSLVAAASVASGVLVEVYGWETVNLVLLPLTAFALLLIGWLAWEGKGKA